MRDSTHPRTALSILMVTVALCATAPAAPPQETRPAGRRAESELTGATRPGDTSFAKVIDHVRAAEASGAWQKAGWKDAVIEEALGGLVDQMKRAAARNDLKLPVALGDVHPGGGE